MRRIESAMWWGLLLIAGGILFLLQNLNLLSLNDYIWAILMGGAGLVFLGQFALNRQQWWALIPGLVLVSLAALFGLQRAAPDQADWLGGSIVLGGIGLAFFGVYLSNTQHWWAVIPGGVLATLATVAGVDGWVKRREISGFESGGVFFLGLGLTFALLYLLPTPHGRQKWAIYPAAPLLVMGLLLGAGSAALAGVIWPVALIAGGLVLLVRALRPRHS